MSVKLVVLFALAGAVVAQDVAEDGESLVEKLAALDSKFQAHIDRIDMLIKFYHPEWSQSAGCGRACPYNTNLLDYAAVQWKFPGSINGGHDLEFSDERGRLHGNMDFYERHMYLWDCGKIAYLTNPPEGDGTRTWTFAKTAAGFKLYCETTLLVDFTYTEGKCASLWAGPNVGFFFESPVQFHMLQHGMDMFWFVEKVEKLVVEDNDAEL